MFSVLSVVDSGGGFTLLESHRTNAVREFRTTEAPYRPVASPREHEKQGSP